MQYKANGGDPKKNSSEFQEQNGRRAKSWNEIVKSATYVEGIQICTPYNNIQV